MTDMTAEERAERALSEIEFVPDRFDKRDQLAVHIRQAEAAARKAVKEHDEIYGICRTLNFSAIACLLKGFGYNDPEGTLAKLNELQRLIDEDQREQRNG